MSVVDKIRQCNGVTNFLCNYEIGFTSKQSFRKQDNFFNNILLEFGKQNEINGFVKNNSPKYKGNFNPLIQNANLIQENWNIFSKWVISNYNKKAKK